MVAERRPRSVPIASCATAPISSSVSVMSVAVVGVRLIELHHRELGVVLRRDPLVPEVPVDLEHPLHSADGEPLQIQLGRDAEIQVHVERVVMRDERAGERTAGDRLHHRRLDFEEAARRHERANRGDHAAPSLEYPARFGVDHEIQIALAVPNLDVGQPVPLLGKGQQALREEVQPGRPDGQLVGLGAEQPPLDANPVAEIEQLEDLEVERRAASPRARRPESSRGRRRSPGSSPCRTSGSRECGRSTTVSGRSASSSSWLRPPWASTSSRDGVLALERSCGYVRDAEPRQLLQVRAPLLNLFVLRRHPRSQPR